MRCPVCHVTRPSDPDPCADCEVQAALDAVAATPNLPSCRRYLEAAVVAAGPGRVDRQTLTSLAASLVKLLAARTGAAL
jgi:hypothetical protein